MTGRLSRREIQLDPGCIVVPDPPAYLFGVSGSTVLLTLWCPQRRRGGMCHVVLPRRPSPRESTPWYAGPAVCGLVRFLGGGSPTARQLRSWQAGVFGGAERRDAQGHVPGLGGQNVAAVRDLLAHYGIGIRHQSVGGRSGRKVVFHSGSGEVACQEVDRIRSGDWYPVPAAAGSRR